MLYDMEPERLIDDIAKELGVTAAARKKWRQRGVPHRWRLPIMRAAAGRGVVVPDSAFEAPDRPDEVAA